MTRIEFQNLQRGDIVKHVEDESLHSLIVTANYGDRVTAVRTVDLTNPVEWEVIAKAVQQ